MKAEHKESLIVQVTVICISLVYLVLVKFSICAFEGGKLACLLSAFHALSGNEGLHTLNQVLLIYLTSTFCFGKAASAAVLQVYGAAGLLGFFATSLLLLLEPLEYF